MSKVTTKERPILFSSQMVCAILDGKKTQTRRVIKPQPIKQHHIRWMNDPWNSCSSWCVLTNYASVVNRIKCPYGEPGERLWVRESFEIVIDPAASFADEEPFSYEGVTYQCPPALKYDEEGNRLAVDYKATPPNRMMDQPGGGRRWRPSIHMPRWASRINLEVTKVRAERLNLITLGAIETEGFTTPTLDEFWDKWDELNAKRGFPAAKNPWVWVVEFKVL